MTLVCAVLTLAGAFLDARPAPEGCSAAVESLFARALPEKAEKRWEDEGGEIWRRRLNNGEWAFVLLNRGQRPVSIDVIWKEHGLSGSPRVYDVLREDDWGKVHGGFAERVEPGEASLLRVQP